MAWRLPVAAAVLVLVVSVGSSPLYRSSTANAAFAREAATTCAVDAGLSLGLTAPAEEPADPRLPGVLARESSPLPVGAAAPALVRTSGATRLVLGGGDDGVFRQATLLHRSGQESVVEPPGPPLVGSDVLVPSPWAGLVGVQAGDELAVSAGRQLLAVRVAGTYGPLGADDPSSPWCGQRSLFALTPLGDIPAPVLLTSDALLDEAEAGGLTVRATWQLPIAPQGLTHDRAARLAVDLDRIARAWTHELETSYTFSPTLFTSHKGSLATMVQRATSVAAVVDGNVRPVAGAAVVASGFMLVAAGVFVARRRRTELELWAVRGAPTRTIARRVLVSVAAAVVAGGVAGAVVVFVAVRALGPSARLDPSAVRQALGLAAGGIVAGLVIVVVATVVTSASAIDRTPRGTRWRAVPYELVPVGLVVLAWRHLDHAGGVQLVGAEVRGDPLGQAFPVLMVAATLAFVARPLARLLRAARWSGRRLPLGLRLGIRRVTAEPQATLVVVLAGALAVATFSSAVLLSDTVEEATHRKAATFVGADLVLRTVGDPLPPASLADRTTVVRRAAARSASAAVDLLVVDPATFARAAAWIGPHREIDRMLSLLDRPAALGSTPAIVVGPALPDRTLELSRDARLSVEVDASPQLFPGFRNGATLVVVSGSSTHVPDDVGSTEVWLHDPPPDAAETLRAAGIRTSGASRPEDVFDATSFLVVRWSYAGMRAFGAVVGGLVLLMQVLVLVSRRRSRQIGFTLTQRMGVVRSAHAAGLALELAVPIAVATALGLTLAAASSALAAPRLDGLRGLRPPSQLVVNAPAAVPVLLVALAAVLALTLAGLFTLIRTDPVEVLRAPP